MKLTPEQITALLSETVAKSLGSEEKPAENMAVKSLEAKVDGLISFISKNVQVEKPKTTEELVAESEARILAAVEKSIKTMAPAGKQEENKETEEDKPLTLTAKSLNDIVSKAVSEAIAKSTTGEAPKGKKADEKDVLDSLIEGLAKSAGLEEGEEEEEEEGEEEEDVAKSVATVEDKNIRGETLSKETKDARQKLDDFLGQKFQFEANRLGISGRSKNDEE